MTQSKYLVFNDEFLPAEMYKIATSNRAFQYGDALFETMFASGTRAHFLEDHIDRLKMGMRTLKMDIPAFINNENISSLITRLLNKNKIFKGARIRLTVFRNDGGFYVPETNRISMLIESMGIQKEKYELNKQGISIDVFPDILKPVNKLSNFKTTNSLIFVLAGIYKTENNLGDCIILNENKNMAEAISSNIFFLSKGKLYTPPLEDGCVAGIIRKKIVMLAPELNMEVIDNQCLEIEILHLADEVFLTNSIAGITWVAAYKDRRYFNSTSKVLVDKLNEIAF